MRSLNLNYFFRRNKYFFIGCLAGFILSSIFMPAFEDCNGQRSHPSSSSFSSQSATLDFRLAQQLQEWFIEVQQPQYEPVQVNTSLVGEESENIPNVVQMFAKDEPLVHDKKLKFYRPRFHHTELKLKNELLLGILINSEQLSSSSSNTSSSMKQQIIEYMNTTTEQLFKHHFSIDVYYFYEERERDFNRQQSRTMMKMASSRMGRSAETVQWGVHTIKHMAILQHLINRGNASDYAFFFLMNQHTLLSVENLLEHLNRLTNSDEALSTMNSGKVRSMFAHDDSVLNNGLLISASLLNACQLDGPCLMKRSPVYTSHTAYHLSRSSDSANTIFDAITVYPVVFNSQMDHMLRSAIEAERIGRLKETLTALENQIIAENNKTLWPLGVFGYQRAHTRYEVSRWSYWNATHAFMSNDIQVIRRLSEAELGELRDLRAICSQWIDGVHSHISTVYRKFDAVRGLEYLIDFTNGKTPLLRRLQVVKPLNPLELITDVPYVTENMHLTLVLPVRGSSEVPLAIRFLHNYATVCLKKDNHATTLIIVLIYTRHLHLSESIESTLEYERQEFSRLKKVSLYIQAKISAEEVSKVKMVFLDFHPPDPLSEFPDHQSDESTVRPLSSFPSELAYLDLIARSLTLTTESSTQPFLLLHCRSNMLLSTDFLNRVRLNTIAGRQIFLPIPFVEYRLRTTVSNSIFQQMIHQQQQSPSARTDFRRSLTELVNKGRGGDENDLSSSASTDFDVRKENGYFDHLNYEFVSFYLSDYLTARRSPSQLPMIRNHQSVVKYQHLVYNATTNLRHLFSSSISLAQMRAVEPELRLHHSEIIADSCEYFESNVHSLESCRHRRAVGLGPKQKLASIVLEYLEFKRRFKDENLVGNTVIP